MSGRQFTPELQSREAVLKQKTGKYVAGALFLICALEFLVVGYIVLSAPPPTAGNPAFPGR